MSCSRNHCTSFIGNTIYFRQNIFEFESGVVNRIIYCSDGRCLRQLGLHSLGLCNHIHRSLVGCHVIRGILRIYDIIQCIDSFIEFRILLGYLIGNCVIICNGSFILLHHGSIGRTSPVVRLLDSKYITCNQSRNDSNCTYCNNDLDSC